MLNFYKFYNKTGLDNEHYGPLINSLQYENYTSKLKPIEHLIKKKPFHAYFYALKVLKCRWSVAEPYILKSNNSLYAYIYAMHIMEERWIEAEPCIMKNTGYAYEYSRRIIKGRWEEAEQYIKQSPFWWDKYCMEFNI